MGRFLAIYNGVASEEQKQELSPAQQHQFVTAWGQWAAAHEGALVDPGAPLFRKRRVTSRGVEEFTDSKTGYAIVVADCPPIPT